MVIPPFNQSGNWYKGNLHTHTSRSDGKRSPSSVLRWHAKNGYDFVAVTDHDKITTESPPDNLTVLAGSECTIGESRTGAPVHLIAVALPGTMESVLIPKDYSAVGRLRDTGALTIVAHPYWSGLIMEDLMQLNESHGIEIFNTGCEVERFRGLSTVHWDQVLQSGWKALGFAADDSHWELPDHGGGFVLCNAQSRKAEHILNALKQGHFYSSQGPIIKSVELKGRKIKIHTSEARAICWLGDSRRGWCTYAKPGKSITKAKFNVDPASLYVRVQVQDHKGRWAWSQAFPLNPEA